MAKFQDTAKAKGIELPPVLQNIDRETGLPAIVSDSKKEDGEGDVMVCFSNYLPVFTKFIWNLSKTYPYEN